MTFRDRIVSLVGFTGDLIGNVTGNASGSSGSCSGNAATATTATGLASVVADTTTAGVASGTALKIGGRASSTTADSAELVGNGAAQTFSQSVSIPANTLTAGKTVRVSGIVRSTGLNGADLSSIALRLGGQSYVTSNTDIAASGDRCVFDAFFTARAAPGAAVAVIGGGGANWTTAASVQKVSATGPNLATNGALTLDVQWTGVNNAGNKAVLESLIVDVI